MLYQRRMSIGKIMTDFDRLKKDCWGKESHIKALLEKFVPHPVLGYSCASLRVAHFRIFVHHKTTKLYVVYLSMRIVHMQIGFWATKLLWLKNWSVGIKEKKLFCVVKSVNKYLKNVILTLKI